MNDSIANDAADRLPDVEGRQDRLEQLVEDLLKEAKRRGASEAEAAVSSDAGLSVTVRMGDVETIEHTRDNGLGVTVYFGKKKGSASTSDFSPDAVRDTVEAACNIARFTMEDDCAGLADPDLMASAVPDLALYHPWHLPVALAIEMCLESENAARTYDQRIANSEGATLGTYAGLQVYGNSHGFVGGYPSTRHSLSCSVVGRQGDSMQRDYWYTADRDADCLESGVSVGQEAARRTLARLGARKIATCQAPVIFQAEVATSLLRSFVSAIRGAALYRKASFLLDHLKKQVFPNDVRIREEPHLPGALGSAAFDGEGVATVAKDFVTEGILTSYVLDSYSARKLGLNTTGNAGGVRNLVIEPGTLDKNGLLAKMDRGLLVTELMGQGVNPVTGDYSRGAAGFWVEGGEIQYPVEEITIAGNLKDMFRGLTAIGTDLEKRGNYRTGSWLIDGMTIAGS